MSAGSQTKNGKAFEYACLVSIHDRYKDRTEMVVEDSPQMRTAKSCFESLAAADQLKLRRAANAAVKVIDNLEPMLEYGQAGPLIIAVQTDAQGIAGDVRDVICVRRGDRWSIGLSCKHNHHAVKHSRLSSTIDFGEEWMGYPCSKQYFSEVRPIFAELKHMKETGNDDGSPVLWEQLENKAERFYIPVLKAFVAEIRRLQALHSDVPEKLIRYLLGRYDFYKVITNDKSELTRIEAINLSGTLNRPGDGHKARVNVERVKLPSRIIACEIKPGSDNTVELVCDEGWALSMRIHSASKRVEASLKFDIKLLSLPNAIYTHDEPW